MALLPLRSNRLSVPRSRSFVSATTILSLAALPGAAQSHFWIEQFGTSAIDVPDAAAPDGAGGEFVRSWTDGSLGGPTSAARDAWIARHDRAGSALWIRQLGTGEVDYALAVAVDGLGGVHVAGQTAGSLGGPNAGGVDAWLAR